jgi:hypothetical protein
MYFVNQGSEEEMELVNLKGSVGSNEIGTQRRAENRPSEVHFVAFLFQRVFSPSSIVVARKNPEITKLVDRVTLNKLPLSQQVNRLSRAIKLYQLQLNKHYRCFLPDGRIDPFRGNMNSLSGISQTHYTIVSIQMDYFCLDNNPAVGGMSMALERDVMLPPDVRSELFGYM